MRNTLISSVILSLAVLGGCQGTAPVQSDSTTAPKAAEAPKPALSDEAKQALAKAEADVKEAGAQKALWTTAEANLKKAKEAAAKGDSAATLKFAKAASEQAMLGIQQKSYPSTK